MNSCCSYLIMVNKGQNLQLIGLQFIGLMITVTINLFHIFIGLQCELPGFMDLVSRGSTHGEFLHYLVGLVKAL